MFLQAQSFGPGPPCKANVVSDIREQLCAVQSYHFAVAAAPSNVTSDIRGVITYGDKSSSSLPTSTSWNATNPDCVDLDQLKPLVNSQLDVNPAITMFLNYTFPTVVNGFPEIVVNGNVYNVSDFAYPTLFNFNENPSWKPTVPGEQRNLLVIPDNLLGKEIRLILHSFPAMDGWNHPFHRHGGGFKVLASGTSQITQADIDKITAYDVITAVERDTVVVPKDGWVVTQYVSGYAGRLCRLIA
jgi:Multicopper oxidase